MKLVFAIASTNREQPFGRKRLVKIFNDSSVEIVGSKTAFNYKHFFDVNVVVDEFQASNTEKVFSVIQELNSLKNNEIKELNSYNKDSDNYDDYIFWANKRIEEITNEIRFLDTCLAA